MVQDRALATARFFARDGTLLATVAQEGAVRWQQGAETKLRQPLQLQFVSPPLVPASVTASIDEVVNPLVSPAPPVPRL